MAEKESGSNIVQSMVESSYQLLEALNRHAMAGLFLLPLWYFSFPDKLITIDFNHISWSMVVLIGASSVVLGNAWYVAHKFTVHFMVDYWCFNTRERPNCHYSLWLAKHLVLSHNGNLQTLKTYIKYRSSLINLLYIVAEGLMFFPFIADQNSIVGAYRFFLIMIGLILMLYAAMQHQITFTLDDYVTNKAF